ncbi:MAG: RNHCP domain-containing protein [Candidatus Beckwithbacteria bacterium]|nr:RNHCP domain-containing protein [Candidatus Beckwithbacteria bacterium]
MLKHFTKVDEDFICEFCGQITHGTGYTNHCPNCLYSKHVDDQFPGDRASKCQTLMKPIGVQIKNGRYIIFHQCHLCRKITRNKTDPEDNKEKLIELSTKPIK